MHEKLTKELADLFYAPISAAIVDGEVEKYSDLPAAASHPGEFYMVRLVDGIYPNGLYYCDGASWTPSPSYHAQNTDLYLATQPGATIYVDKNRTDTYTATGNITKPFKTIQEAENYREAQVLTKAIIKVAPGDYSENLTINNDNYLLIDLECAHIIGNVTWNISAAVASFKAKLIFRGHDGRGYYPTSSAYTLNGIQGDVTITQASGTSRYIGLHLVNTGIVGNITLTGNGYLSHLFFMGSGYTGDIISNDTCQAMVYAYNSHFSGSASIGGAQGKVSPYSMSNVEMTRPWVIGVPIGGAGGDLRNVIFKTGSNFTGYTGAIKMDNYSFKSYITNVVAGSETITLMDGGRIVTTTASTYSLTTEKYLNVNYAGVCVVTLPTAVGRSGQSYHIKNLTANSTTVNTTGGQTIDGAGSLSISGQYTSAMIVSDGSNWFIH